MTTENKTTETVETDRVSSATPNDGLNPAETDEVSKETPIEQEQTKANKEAAKYRTRLRETEQQLSQAQASLQAAREEALRYAALKHRFGETASEQANSPIIIEDALKDHAFDTDKLYTPEGNIDQTALREELDALLESKPYYFQHRIGAYVSGEGKTPSDNSARHSFTEAFRPGMK